VRRIEPGERVDVTDGAGLMAQCMVIAARRGELELAVLATRAEPEPVCRVAVAQAILKGDRAELAVELMTEVGVDAIVPWAAERSIAKWPRDRVDRALGRWRSAAIAAAKQSRRSRFPVVGAPVTTTELGGRVAGASLAVLLDPAAPDTLDGLLARTGAAATVESAAREATAGQPAVGQSAAREATAGQPAVGQSAAREAAAGQPAAGQPAAGQPAAGQPAAGQPAAGQPAAGQPAAGVAAVGQPSGGWAVRHGEIVLIVGPEGGISPAESEQLMAAGARPARLGPSVLRGSTAGAVASALILSRCGRWD
jgi:16S rRNA (uracil1498-N3)-methyltransferase